MNNEEMNQNPVNNGTEPLVSTDLGNLNPSPMNSEVLGETTAVNPETPVEPAAPIETLDGSDSLNVGFNPEVNTPNPNVDIPPITTVESNTDMVIEPVEKKKKKGPIVLIIVLLILAILGGLGYVFKDQIMGFLPFGNATPKQIFENAIDRIDPKSMLNTNFKTETGTFKLLLEPSSDVDYKNMELSGKYYFDKDAEYIKMALTAKYGDDSLDGNVYLINDNAYIYVKDLLDKYMTMPLEGLWDISSSADSEIDLEKLDISGIAERVLANLKSSLKDEYFTQTKEGNLTKSTFTLAGINQLKFEKDLYTNNKNDSVLISLLEKAGLDKEDIIDDFDDSIEALEEAIEDYDDSYAAAFKSSSISIYTTSPKNINKIELKSSLYTITIDNIIKGGFDYKFTVLSSEDSQDITGKVTYTLSQTEPSYKITINVPAGKITVETSAKYNDSFEKDEIDKTKVVNINELDEMDQLFLQLNMMNNKFITSIMEDFSSGNVMDSLEDFDL